MNFKQFIKKLPDTVLHKFLVNVFKFREHEGNESILEFLNESLSYDEWIDFGFNWGLSLEGASYWNAIYYKNFEEVLEPGKI